MSQESVVRRHTRLSGLEPLVITPELNFINIGERTNVTGSARFKRLILEDRFDEAAELMKSEAVLKEVGKEHLLTWPLTRAFRETPQFKDAFE